MLGKKCHLRMKAVFVQEETRFLCGIIVTSIVLGRLLPGWLRDSLKIFQFLLYLLAQLLDQFIV